MRPKTHALLLCLLTSATACGPRPRSTPPAPTPTPQTSQQPAAASAPVPKSATCALLSDADLREVQGEGPSDAQGSEHLAGGLVMSQCFYRLPTFSESVSLEVVRAPSDAQSTGLVRDYWRQKFQRGAGEGGGREREEESKRENVNGQTGEGGHHERESEEETHTRRVAGVGDEAYWSGGERGGTLSVLKKDAVVGVSVGGPEEESEGIRKAKALAEKVLKHF